MPSHCLDTSYTTIVPCTVKRDRTKIGVQRRLLTDMHDCCELKAAGIRLPVDDRVRQYVRQQVADGIYNVTSRKKRQRLFLKKRCRIAVSIAEDNSVKFNFHERLQGVSRDTALSNTPCTGCYTDTTQSIVRLLFRTVE